MLMGDASRRRFFGDVNDTTNVGLSKPDMYKALTFIDTRNQRLRIQKDDAILLERLLNQLRPSRVYGSDWRKIGDILYEFKIGGIYELKDLVHIITNDQFDFLKHQLNPQDITG